MCFFWLLNIFSYLCKELKNKNMSMNKAKIKHLPFTIFWCLPTLLLMYFLTFELLSMETFPSILMMVLVYVVDVDKTTTESHQDERIDKLEGKIDKLEGKIDK